jgi:hypothetical protein
LTLRRVRALVHWGLQHASCQWRCLAHQSWVGSCQSKGGSYADTLCDPEWVATVGRLGRGPWHSTPQREAITRCHFPGLGVKCLLLVHVGLYQGQLGCGGGCDQHTLLPCIGLLRGVSAFTSFCVAACPVSSKSFQKALCLPVSPHSPPASLQFMIIGADSASYLQVGGVYSSSQHTKASTT